MKIWCVHCCSFCDVCNSVLELLPSDMMLLLFDGWWESTDCGSTLCCTHATRYSTYYFLLFASPAISCCCALRIAAIFIGPSPFFFRPNRRVCPSFYLLGRSRLVLTVNPESRTRGTIWILLVETRTSLLQNWRPILSPKMELLTVFLHSCNVHLGLLYSIILLLQQYCSSNENTSTAHKIDKQ